ncbi:crossover junction endodeoxyribonuclease RuvC [Bacillus cereus]|uniref:crossover junction endodeoxyribonuclease RuvC n=1 Tax=Bacillus cereus TaxID=1396 RepID=UPI0024074C51|nr:crossover junction endodeoxyribonuclease RuvC [Bacillus cereus]MDF9611884.1 crossover junction endodeoxyribonuclease RuvC [Bacillus cereus]
MTVTRYIGLDISARSTGFAIIDRVDEGSISKNDGQIFLRHVGHIPIPASYRHQGQTVKYTDGERLHTLRTALWEILDAYQPDIFIKEGLAMNFSRFRASEIVAKATGVVEECIAADFTKEKHQEILEYKPSTIKKEIAGHGKADKLDVQKGVFYYFSPEAHNFPYKNKRDGSKEYNDDATDAVASVLTHFEKNGMKYWTERSRENLL